MKRLGRGAVLLFISVLFLTGCRGEDEALGDSRLYDEMSGEGEGDIIIGFSEIGSESDWRRAHTESFKSTFSSENGYYLLFEDAQQKQENQLKADRLGCSASGSKGCRDSGDSCRSFCRGGG